MGFTVLHYTCYFYWFVGRIGAPKRNQMKARLSYVLLATRNTIGH